MLQEGGQKHPYSLISLWFFSWIISPTFYTTLISNKSHSHVWYCCKKKSMNLQFGQIYSYLEFSTSGIKSGTVDLWEKSKTDQQRWMILMTFLMHQEDKTPFIGTQEDREALFSRLQSPWMFRSWANASYFPRSHSRGVATPDPGNSVPDYILNEFHIIGDRYKKWEFPGSGNGLGLRLTNRLLSNSSPIQ